MTRFKKELIKHGIKLETCFPYLPIQVNSLVLESRCAFIINNRICVSSWYCELGRVREYYNNNFKLIETEYFDEDPLTFY